MYMLHVQKPISQCASSNRWALFKSKESFRIIQNYPNIKHFKKIT